MSTLGYLRISTPKRKGSHQLTESEKEKLKEDAKKESEKAGPIKFRPTSNWTGNNMDPDSVSRHYRSLKRAGFSDNNHAKGFF